MRPAGPEFSDPAQQEKREKSARTFTLPDDVDGSNVRAELKDGVLTLHVPKSEKANPRPLKSTYYRDRSGREATSSA
jgi:HSP20 family molecular chaperone IbpA